ncbi:MAG: DNA polymerase IV [Bacteroidales bacterium]
MSHNRHILHLDQDTFFVSVERLHNSSLNRKPVIIGGAGDRGVVASCSYEARQSGVHSAMPIQLARRLCPEAIFIRGDMERYTKYSDLVTAVIADKAPLFEKASIDEHYLDLSGMDRFFGCRQWAGELRREITAETGLPISMGLSLNKTVAKIATGEAKPDGQMYVDHHIVRSFLDPLSVRKIPMVGPKTYHRLRTMGIATIHTLRNLPPEVPIRMLGKNGKEIWQRANGIDHAPVQAWREHRSVSSETTFDNDTIHINYIEQTLIKQCEQLSFRLRTNQQLTGCVTVRIRYTNFDTHTLQQQLPYTAFDHMLVPVCKTLFNRLYKRRMRIRLIGLQFSRLIRGVQQLNLFEDSPEMARLYQAMDKMRRKYGTQTITKGICTSPPSQFTKGYEAPD